MRIRYEVEGRRLPYEPRPPYRVVGIRAGDGTDFDLIVSVVLEDV